MNLPTAFGDLLDTDTGGTDWLEMDDLVEVFHRIDLSRQQVRLPAVPK